MKRLGRTWAPGLLLAILALGAVAVAFAGGGSSTSTRTVRSVVPRRGTVSSTGCSLPAGSQDASAVNWSPPAATWGEVGQIWVPQAPATLGPQHTTSDGWSYCWAHSPGGAVLAAINFYAEATAHTSAEVTRHYAVKIPPGATLASTSLRAYSLAFAGYRLDSYSRDRAVVAVVLTLNGSGDVEGTPTMQWVPALGDWRVALPPSGAIPAQVVDSSLAGFVDWRMP